MGRIFGRLEIVAVSSTTWHVSQCGMDDELVTSIGAVTALGSPPTGDLFEVIAFARPLDRWYRSSFSTAVADLLSAQPVELLAPAPVENLNPAPERHLRLVG
ncbi:hypothetical protein [Naasia lichenicola]|uniref:Uncharacterized protein n=1 Tax=Naasia lichenicola TaxID=2565933 RepID=A0A4S4FJ41_9MICO|nr:hypothetical protein [Naasia lichenicola]THG30121.1 hypothetical protein E6C64_15930 [Naasia lichenicola]